MENSIFDVTNRAQDAVESACKAALPRGLSPTENDVRFAVCIGWINLSLSNGMF